MGRNTSTLKGYEGFLEDFEKLWGCGWKLIVIPDYPEAIRLVKNTNGGSHGVEVHCPITAIALECYGYESGRKCDRELLGLLGYPHFVFSGVHAADSKISCTTGSELRKKMLRMIS